MWKHLVRRQGQPSDASALVRTSCTWTVSCYILEDIGSPTPSSWLKAAWYPARAGAGPGAPAAVAVARFNVNSPEDEELAF